VGAPDGVLGAAFAIGRDQREYLICRVYNLLIAGVVAPRDLTLALCAIEMGTEDFGGETAAACRLFRPSIWANCSTPHDYSILRETGHEPINVSRSVRFRAPMMAMYLDTVGFLSSPSIMAPSFGRSSQNCSNSAWFRNEPRRCPRQMRGGARATPGRD
jgi:hypothetical protein